LNITATARRAGNRKSRCGKNFYLILRNGSERGRFF
jgi:hypothetical protein